MTIEKAGETPATNGTSIHPPPLHTFPNITLQSTGHTLVAGTLCIHDGHLDWRRGNSSVAEWSTPFRALNLHALSTEAEDGPPCVYAQVGEEFEEVRFLGELGVLREIYKSLCDAAERNGDEDEDGSGFMFGGAGGEMGIGEDDGMVARLDGLITIEEGAMQDAEEDEEGHR